jgi:hypothetical protein
MNKSLPFHERRRQQFLTENYYQVLAKHFGDSAAYWAANTPEADSPQEAKSLAAASIADDSFMLWILRYTAGEPIEQLRSELTSVVEAYERYQKALEAYEQVPEIAPLGLGEIGQYERCMQLIGLCYLLHRRDLLPRIIALEDPAYAGADAFYEDFLSYEMSDRFDTNDMLHIELYDRLVHAMYAETDEESVEDIQKYVLAWYPAFKYVPWHDGHLRINGTDGDYFGYWAFEAGAVAYLLDLDDSSITHMVYPKDLVAWARANKHLSEEASNDAQHGRCEAGQPCPREGFWFTPAQVGSRRFFKAGEVLPEFKSDYGLTIWQWDPNQSH